MEKSSKEAAKNKISPLSPSQSSVISLSSSCSSNRDSFYSEDSDLDGWDIEGNIRKKQMIEPYCLSVFLTRLHPKNALPFKRKLLDHRPLEIIMIIFWGGPMHRL
ncbi:Hypothetical predicted protein [Olea europaea subsp. europaea]|uniref:Uncharacterized protein n=1 Tax=Olea europaea subsp. europaea TaxID=158383 RepID=A0A8S0QYS5_OLEEU|nr:Hypothetical predicted protein [Olea europaea subsp. europaea]